MKKLFALLCSVIILASCVVPSFAADETAKAADVTIEMIDGRYVLGNGAYAVYAPNGYEIKKDESYGGEYFAFESCYVYEKNGKRDYCDYFSVSCKQIDGGIIVGVAKTPMSSNLLDANLDKSVNARDAIDILKHIAEYDTGVYDWSADVNGDGKVTTEDAVVILRDLAGWYDRYIS